MMNVIKRQVQTTTKNVIILGAAGRDFHDFNTHFRNNPEYNVVCFTATQIPDIDGRAYPAELAGELYPEGINIYDESDLAELIEKYDVDECVLSYSDLAHTTVMNLASTVLAEGADFKMLGPNSMMMETEKPVIAITAVRTGCGKSQTARKVSDWLREKGIKAVAMRHPMPYGDLLKQKCQRYENYDDLVLHECTIEEMEEYEPYIERGLVIYAGVDYQEILSQAEKEADVLIWDGGNNDLPFMRSTTCNIQFVIADPFRPGHEVSYHPGETNFKMSDAIIINKMDSAPAEGVDIIEENIEKFNPEALVIHADSACTIQGGEDLKGKRVVIVEDGPTLSHGEMKIGAGYVAAKAMGCEIIPPKEFTVGSITETMEKFGLDQIIPAMGYGKEQMQELEDSINNCECDAIIVGTPIDLAKHLEIKLPNYRVVYDLEERDNFLSDILEEKIVPCL